MRRRIAAAAVIAVGLMLALAACTFSAPQATMIHYDPSDGIGVTVGNVELRNAFVVSPDGQDANLVGALINSTGGAKTVYLQYTSTVDGKKTTVDKTVTLPASGPNGEVIFGNAGVPQVVFTGTDVKPGALLRVFVRYGNVTGKSVLLPVLDGSQSAYSTLTPSPTPTPTGPACKITDAGAIVNCPFIPSTSTPTPTTTPN